MKVEEGAIKRLMEYLVAHLYKDTPDSERSERGLRAVSGQLGRNPPYVEVTRQFDDPTAEVVGSAISPNGEIALVFAQNAANPLTKRLSLITYGNDGRFSQVFSIDSVSTDKPDVRVWRLASSKPVVLIGSTKLLWGIYNLTIPNPVDCLTLWCDHGLELHVWYVIDGEAFHEVLGKVIDKEAEHARLNANGPTRWLGLIGGSLAQITVEDGHDVLRWNDLKVAVLSGPIMTESIVVFAGCLQFVVDSGRAGWTVYYSDGRELHSSTVPKGDVIFGDGQIFLVHRGPNRREIMRLEANTFVRSGGGMPMIGMMPAIGKNARIFDLGETVVVSDFTLPVDESVRRVWKITGSVTSSSSSRPNDLAIERFHHGIALHRKRESGEEYVHWEAPSALKIGAYDNFPLYGTPFDRLTAVEDDRGKAIMSWAFTDGTFHVLRYPLPR